MQHSWQLGLFLACGIVLGATASAHARQPPGDRDEGEAVPGDFALLDLDVPASATVSLDGVDQGRRRRVRIGPFSAGVYGKYEVRARFRNGRELSRNVWLRGGWHVRLPMQGTPGARPEIVVQTGHSDAINAVAFSPDGRHCLTGSSDNTAILWEARTGQQVATLQGHTSEINSVAFSPDGRRCITGSSDARAIVWDVSTGRKLLILETRLVSGVAFSPDGLRCLTGSADNLATLWDAGTGQKLMTFQGHTDWVTAVAFSPDGRRLVTGSKDRTACVWDAGTGQRLATFSGHSGTVNAVAFSPDGLHCVSGGGDAALAWDAATGGRPMTLEGTGNEIEALAFSPDGRHVLGGSVDGGTLWDARTGRKVATLQGHDRRVVSVAFSPDGLRGITGSWDGTAILWDVRTGRQLNRLQGHCLMVNGVAVSADGRRAVTGAKDDTAVVWDMSSGRRLTTFRGQSIYIYAVAFSPDGRRCLTGAGDTTAVVWDAESGRTLTTLRGHSEALSAVAFSPDGRRCLTGSRDSTARVWDAETGRSLTTFKGHGGWVSAVAFSPDGRHCLTGSLDGTAILWDAESGKPRATLPASTIGVNAVAFRPDGRRIVVGTTSETSVWDVQTGRKLMGLAGHDHWIRAVAYSADGSRILTGSRDNTAILWDATAGRQILRLQGHSAEITGVAFSAGDRRGVTTSADGTTRLWDLATGEELVKLVSLDAGKDWLVITPEGLFDGSEGGRQRVTFRVGGELSVVPVDRFFQDFYRSALLTEIDQGLRPRPETALGLARPPRVKLVTPQRGGVVEKSPATLVVEAEDQGGGVQGPWVVHNGARIAAAGPAEREGNVLRRSFRVALVEGENHLVVNAASGDGSWESEPASITLTYTQRLPKPSLYVLAIGASRYADSSLDLKYASADAHALSEVFRRRGAALYREVHVRELLDDDATRTQVRKALEELSRMAGPQDTLVVSLAGHGTMVGQRYYFIPHEFRRTEGSDLESDIRAQGVPADTLADWLGTVPALKRVLILDTCQSGGAVRLGHAGRSPFELRGAIERLGRAQGVFTIAAAATGEEAQEVSELGHGILTYTLLAALNAVERGPLAGQPIRPSSSERVADVLEWFSFASGQVPRLAQRYFGHEQDVETSVRGSSFPILPLEEP